MTNLAKQEKNSAKSKGLNVPFNLDPLALEGIININTAESTRFPVRQIYFSEPASLTGNGRLRQSLPESGISLSDICNKSHDSDIEVFYVMNAPSLGGREWTSDFQNALEIEIGRIESAGIDGIILTSPYLSNRIRELAPSITITVSVNARISTVTMLGEVKAMWNADRFYVHPSRSRSLSLIEAMHQAYSDIHLVALVNESCLLDCPLQPHHQDYLAQTTRIGCETEGPDYCHAMCGVLKLSDDLNVLKSPWMPPEGIHYLFEAGITRIKLAGRTLDTPRLLDLIKAYACGSYKGDIWPFFETSGLTSPEWQQMLGKKMDPCRYRVDNATLSTMGFIDYFASKRPPCTEGRGCGNCRHCEEAMSAVTPPKNKFERLSDLQYICRMVETDQWRNKAMEKAI